jgi:hypothetical protein
MRENEDARISGVLSRHEFFGDEVHAISEWRYESDPRQTIESGQGRPRQAAIDVANGRLVEFRKLPIDASGCGLELASQCTILRDLTARVWCDLQVVKAAAKVRLLRQ